MQLVAYGAQDIYLTGNPQITFFKVVYRRHTNFSMEAIEQTFDGSLSFGGRVSCTISRNGDLVHKMYIQYIPTEVVGAAAGSDYYPKFGCGLLKEVELEIGGQMIDRHYSHWLSAYEDLTQKNEYRLLDGSDKDVNYAGGDFTRYQTLSGNYDGYTDAESLNVAGSCEHFMPLQFWFCRNVGLALPLIALQYHEVKLYWTLPSDTELAATHASRTVSNCKLFVDYIYLDTDERRRFAQVSHEYLIEQLQYEEHALSSQLELNFNHPVKELVWGGKPSTAGVTPTRSPLTTFHRLQSSTNLSADSESTFNTTLKLNGHERFAPRGATYFSRQQIFDYHTGPGSLADMDALCVYSFALKPEEHQPSGTCNFSRIDSAILQFNKSPNATPGTGDTAIDAIRVYAVNYNVLRIMSGMGGLAYSN